MKSKRFNLTVDNGAWLLLYSFLPDPGNTKLLQLIRLRAYAARNYVFFAHFLAKTNPSRHSQVTRVLEGLFAALADSFSSSPCEALP